MGCDKMPDENDVAWFGLPEDTNSSTSGIVTLEDSIAEEPKNETLEQKVRRKRNDLLRGIFE